MTIFRLLVYPDSEIIYGVAACWIDLMDILCGRMNYDRCDIKQWMNLTLWLKFGNINTKITKTCIQIYIVHGTQ